MQGISILIFLVRNGFKIIETFNLATRKSVELCGLGERLSQKQFCNQCKT